MQINPKNSLSISQMRTGRNCNTRRIEMNEPDRLQRLKSRYAIR
jgi:hypothetical protein